MGNSLLAFGFANLAVLGWLVAAAAPLLIHLWSRQRHLETHWAAMQFLLAALRKNARRLQIQQWLLLALRTLVLMLIVLAAAEPYGEQSISGGSSLLTHKVLVIDGSYSMDCRENDATRFGQAKKLAAQLVRDSRTTDSFTVILASQPSQIVISSQIVDRATIISRIEALAQTHKGLDSLGLLSLVREALIGHSDKRPASEHREVIFFTDLQRRTWEQIAVMPAETGMQSTLASLSTLAELSVIDVGKPSTPNTAVSQVIVSDPLITPGSDIGFTATIRHFGNTPRTNCAAKLLIDDMTVGEQTVDIPSNGEATVLFSQRFRTAGEYRVAIQITPDQLTVDDVRWLIVPVRRAVRVLCVEGRAGEARYVISALDPNPASPSPIEPVVVRSSELEEIDFSDFDSIFLCNVPQLGQGQAERLRLFAAGGGGIVVFLGDLVQPGEYNEFTTTDPPLLPVTLGELVSQPQFGLDPLDYHHPIVAPFRGRERAGLLTTPVNRYYRLELPDYRPNLKLVAALPNGDPFIVASSVGDGRVAVVATAASLAPVDMATGEPWTLWPTWPSFLPIIRGLLTYTTTNPQTMEQPVATPLAGQVPTVPLSEFDPGTLRLVRPDGHSDPVSIQTTTRGWEWSYDNTDVSGIYTLQGLPKGESRQFALNVNTDESDLAALTLQELPSEISRRGADPNYAGNSTTSQLADSDWSQALLWLVLGLLLTESCLAWQFGRGSP